jgi:hypothetical protein
MHGFGLPQRHAEGLIRRGAVLAAAALACTGLLASGATASTGDTLTLNPAAAPITQLQQFNVSGAITDATGTYLDVLIGGAAIGTVNVGDGGYTGTVTPPPAGEPGALACGSNTVSIENPPFEGPSPVLATATLTAQCSTPIPSPTPTVSAPTIVLNPATITRASEPAPVGVTGYRFNDRLPVTVTLNGRTVGKAMPDTDGVFTTTITATGLGCGTHRVTAAQQGFTAGSSPTANAPLTVTGCAGRLAINPSVLQPGELTHVTGTGFVAGQPVTLTWRLPHGGPPLLGRLSVTADGKGGIATWFMVMPGDLLGQRQLVATQAGTSAAANAVVDGGPMEPSSADRLIYRAS